MPGSLSAAQDTRRLISLNCGFRIAECGLKKPERSKSVVNPLIRNPQSEIRIPQSY
jgi:hypothetical protein